MKWILGLIVLIVIAVAGYYVYHKLSNRMQAPMMKHDVMPSNVPTNAPTAMPSSAPTGVMQHPTSMYRY